MAEFVSDHNALATFERFNRAQVAEVKRLAAIGESAPVRPVFECWKPLQENLDRMQALCLQEGIQ
jgi:hypothetical protein